MESEQLPPKTGLIESGGFAVKLEAFDGPLDLLLHLVKERELEIELISLAEVTQQYLDYIDRMRGLDLEIAAEYLVVAATLVSIKASILLADPIDLELNPDDVMLDPHKELLLRLREAQVYKQGADQLAARKVLGVDVFATPSILNEIDPPDPGLRSHDILLLGEAFRKLLQRSGSDSNLMKIELSPVSVVEKMMGVLEILKTARSGIDFIKLVGESYDRGSIVVCFIALLELTKRRAISIKQDGVFGAIIVSLGSEDLESEGLESEFDTQSNGEDKKEANRDEGARLVNE